MSNWATILVFAYFTVMPIAAIFLSETQTKYDLLEFVQNNSDAERRFLENYSLHSVSKLTSS
jgi:hypothetical protein